MTTRETDQPDPRSQRWRESGYNNEVMYEAGFWERPS